MSPLFIHAATMISIVRGRAAQARREGRNEIGASAVEWAIISAIVVLLALAVGAAIQGVVNDNIGDIESGSN